LEGLAPRAREFRQRLLGVGHLQTRQIGFGQAARRERGDGTGCLRLGKEIMRIEMFAAQGDEQVAGLQAAGVAVNAEQRDGTIADERRSGKQRVRLGQGHHHADAPARAASAALASSTSEKWCFTPAISW